jgi:hypothetical protein
MRRTSIVLLALSALLGAQAVDPAIDPNTAPSERQQLQKVLAGTDEGAAQLAAYLRDPAVDPAVKHEIVDVFFGEEKAVKHVDAIIQLLVDGNDKLHKQVARRIKSVVKDPVRALALLNLLVDLGLHHKDGKLRLAAVRALSYFPLRQAVERVVDIWGKDKDESVRAECKRVLKYVLLTETPAEARAKLKRYEHHTYLDLRDLVIDAVLAENELLKTYKQMVLRSAHAERCFEVLDGEDVSGHRVVAARLQQLAKESQFKPLDADQFTERILGAFAAQRDLGDPQVVTSLLLTLKELTAGGEKSPLRKNERIGKLFKLLRPMVTKGEGWDAAGVASVELLGALGTGAASDLVSFAGSAHDAVRKAAIDKLGRLAREGTDERDFVGRSLAGLLAKEKSPEVRKQLLFNLVSAPVEQARAPVVALLAKGELSTAEVKNCIEILRALESDESLDALLALVKGEREEKLRLFAVAEGLLARKSTPGQLGRILAELSAIASSDKQPDGLRTGIVAALGERGGREAYAVLHTLEDVKDLADASATAKLALAERLVESAKVQEDLKVATRALAERAGGDLAKLEKLALAILAAGKERKIRVGNARYLRAKLYQAREDRAEPEVRRLLREAVEGAQEDMLDSDLQIALCEEFKTLLLMGKPDQQSLLDAIKCLERLAELLANEQQAKAAGYLLEAATIATDRLKDRVRAEALLKAAEAKGAEAAQVADIRKRVDALPKPS